MPSQEYTDILLRKSFIDQYYRPRANFTRDFHSHEQRKTRSTSMEQNSSISCPTCLALGAS